MSLSLIPPGSLYFAVIPALSHDKFTIGRNPDKKKTEKSPRNPPEIFQKIY